MIMPIDFYFILFILNKLRISGNDADTIWQKLVSRPSICLTTSNDGMKSIEYGPIVGLLVESIK